MAKSSLNRVSEICNLYISSDENVCHSHFYAKTGLERDTTSSTTIYNEVVAKIERFSKLARLMMTMSLVVLMVPLVVGTYFKYYVLRLGDASFQDLPYL